MNNISFQFWYVPWLWTRSILYLSWEQLPKYRLIIFEVSCFNFLGTLFPKTLFLSELYIIFAINIMEIDFLSSLILSRTLEDPIYCEISISWTKIISKIVLLTLSTSLIFSLFHQFILSVYILFSYQGCSTWKLKNCNRFQYSGKDEYNFFHMKKLAKQILDPFLFICVLKSIVPFFPPLFLLLHQ